MSSNNNTTIQQQQHVPVIKKNRPVPGSTHPSARMFFGAQRQRNVFLNIFANFFNYEIKNLTILKKRKQQTILKRLRHRSAIVVHIT